jgi:hypothetical protein
MALFGHSGSHTSQLMHSSVIINAIDPPRTLEIIHEASLAHRAGLKTNALPTTACGLFIWIGVFENFLETVLDKIKLRAVQVDQAVRIYYDFSAVMLEYAVGISDLMSNIKRVRHARTAGLFNAQAQTETTLLRQKLLHTASRIIG